MNIVIDTIKKEISRQNCRFVFPSQTAAETWARKIGGFIGLRSLAGDRFLAWDRFKEAVIETEAPDKKPVSLPVRRLFVEDLIARNGGAPFFRALIPPQYAGDGRIFAESLVKTLPALAYYRERKALVRATYTPGEEDEDLERLAAEYRVFLESRGLFEPSWEKASLRDRGVEYVVFFPEAIEDFDEYRDLLTPPLARLILTGELGGEKPRLLFYPSAREELRGAMLRLRDFHDREGIPWEEMALSVPALPDTEPYLLRELELYHIPFSRRAGKMLGEYGPGRLFSLAGGAAVNSFSFTSLKALVLSDHIPWREREKNKALIRFGIRNNCVSSYAEGAGRRDIWREAFRESGERGLESYYRNLSGLCSSMVRAGTFREIRKFYFVLRNSLLAAEGLSEEENRVLARCIEELALLIHYEEEYPGLRIPSRFDFFVSHLLKTRYVPDNRKPGVNIFPYRVAAGSPFTCHLVLNGSQNSATVLYRPLDFLRQDKREALNLPEKDASGDFFALYSLPAGRGFTPRTGISAAEQGFSGWAIPHSFFAGEGTQPAPRTPADPYTGERRWWGGEGEFPGGIFPLQREGFLKWGSILGERKRFSIQTGPVPSGAAAEMLRERMFREDILTVTPTEDLNPFFACSLFWLYKRIFRLREYSLEAPLLDDASLGLLYHRILERLFSRIGTFDAARFGEYLEWTEEITGEEVGNNPDFKGPLAVPLLRSQAKGITKKIGALLKTEGRFFNRCGVADLEARLESRRGKILFKGIIDRVSVTPEGDFFIVDYKTSKVPTFNQCAETGRSPPEDFQMPMYIRLYEEKRQTPIEGAFFFSINQHDVTVAVGELPGKKNRRTREEYQKTMDALETCIGVFRGALENLDFSLKKIPYSRCGGCVYNTLCRSLYSLNRGAVHG